ncbi:hypothetical protein Enr13x_24970 [Stieleria neptunia]|uniref:Uncharacterized protein n=1 Tax=Stieleria neptunia TaxID=2527979 RepID=A0A518HP78_9BACT|nr:hypothetical protein Enr13x_24970 [Stieleria neptunia]
MCFTPVAGGGNGDATGSAFGIGPTRRAESDSAAMNGRRSLPADRMVQRLELNKRRLTGNPHTETPQSGGRNGPLAPSCMNLRNFDSESSSNVDVGMCRESQFPGVFRAATTRTGRCWLSHFGVCTVTIGRVHHRKVTALTVGARIYLRVFSVELYSALVSRPSSRSRDGLSFCLVFLGGLLNPRSPDPQHDCPPHRPVCRG